MPELICDAGHTNAPGTHFCTECGQRLSSQTASTAQLSHPTPPLVAPLASAALTHQTDAPLRSPRKSHLWRNIAIAVASIVAVVLISEATAERWTKVVIPESPTTYRFETYETGNYDIQEVGESPCWIGQFWSDCINLYIDQYNWACVGISLSVAAIDTCNSYRAMIEEMQSRGSAWSTVSALGSWGTLERSPETASRRVSNNDYRPAVTREAVCYWGVLGECRS